MNIVVPLQPKLKYMNQNVNKRHTDMTKGKEDRRGLYNPENEHDACGVGMVVNIHGNKSHELVDNAL